MSALVGLVFVIAVAAAVISNRDMLSPAKFLLASFALFHVGAWLQPYDAELWMLLLIVLLVVAVAVAIEALGGVADSWPPPRSPPRRPSHADRAMLWLWVLTIPALLAQWYVVDMFDGVAGYVNVLGNRLIEFRGLGWVRTLTAMMMVINLVYFAVGLIERRSRLWWSGYGLHLLLLLSIGLLSGSRSAALNVFAMQLFVFHYLRRNVSLAWTAGMGTLLVFAAGVLGVAREGLKFEDDDFITGLGGAERSFQSSVFTYGVEPLEILLRNDTHELAFGSTFASLLTNPVPRVLWPSKPDTGGVVFTKLYTGDAWEGASNLSPTFLGEWIVNFDWIAGLVMFALSYVALIVLTTSRYRRMLQSLAHKRDRGIAIGVVTYVCVMWSVVALLVGEFTNVVLGLVLTQLLPLAVMRRLLVPRRRRPIPYARSEVPVLGRSG